MVYIIKKNKHYCFHLPRLHFGRENIHFKFKLDKSCSYLISGEDAHDINKLYGISWGYHHKNSFRLGYNCISKGKFQIFSYWYNYGDLYYKPLLIVSEDEWVTANICFDYDKSCIKGYVITDTQSVDIKENFVYPDLKLGYWLYPYFGGNRVALHDTKIEIVNK